MDKPWYRNMFSRSESTDEMTTQTKAENGDADAQFFLGLKYSSSKGLEPDYAQAAHWYLKAAEQSHSLAQFNLGMMYSIGQGVDRDNAKAIIWFRKAAEQGDAGAQHHLGMSHYRITVQGLTPEGQEAKIEAYKWFRLAKAQGYMGSDSICESINIGMSQEEVDKGNQRVAAFVVTPPKPSTN